jgi:hypothetical protein
MKLTPVLLLLSLISVAVQAQPIFRCQDASGQPAFQDRACVEQPAVQAEPARAQQVAYHDMTGETQGGWTNQQRRQRRHQAKAEWRLESVRIRPLLQPERDRKSAEYASSHRRCQLAQRAATMCGSNARAFTCDEKGFHTDPFEMPPPQVTDNGRLLQMRQCTLQVSRGG